MTNITMTEYPDISQQSKTNHRRNNFRWIRYLFAGILINGSIGGIAFCVMKFVPPSYTSEWVISVPGERTQVNINLQEIGNASSSSALPPYSQENDPRDTYQYLVTHKSVLSAAGALIGLDEDETFDEPKIELVENTSMMEFGVNGDSPEEAQKRAWALYQALMSRLELLRKQASKQPNSEKQVALEESRKKLEKAQAEIERYYSDRSINNLPEKIRNISNNIEEIRQQYGTVIAEQQQTIIRVQSLSANLELSPQQATEAFTLQADQLFQQHLSNYSNATANLEIFNATWKPNSPKLVLEKEQQKLAREAMLERSRSLLGKPVDEQVLQLLNLKSNGSGVASKEALLSELISLQTQQQGLEAKARTLGWQVTQLEEQLRDLTLQQIELDSLQRDVEFAEALFNSAKAEFELRESANSASYPEVTLLVEPSLPDKPSFPNPIIVLLGSVAGCLLSTTGLFLIWWDRREGGGLKLFTAEDLNAYTWQSPDVQELNEDKKENINNESEPHI
jgi:uncharacterized protein involved in exopolysaccharide biosynthesis